MTIQQVKARIRELGLTSRYDANTGEFRVNLRPEDGGTEDTAYYTDDRQDALDTAQAMAVGLQTPFGYRRQHMADLETL